MAINAKFIADFTSFTTAVKNAETSLKSFETGASKVEKSLQRMEDSFSGVKIIQQAQLMSATFERLNEKGIGLTSKELQRMGGVANEAAEKMRAMGQTVPPGIQKIVDAAARIAPQLTLAQKATGLLTSAFGQFTLAGLATKAITEITTKVGEFIATGMKLSAVESGFSRLTTSMKQDGATMLSNMTTATRGMVSNYDLMLSANKAMLLGLPVTSASMGELAKTATILGKAMGSDATTALDDLVKALGRSSPMILDNLGLTVKVGEANEAYAAKLGKTVEAMTDAEKKMAFYEAAMEAARRKTAELGEQTQTLGEMIGVAWTQIGNVVSSQTATINIGIGRALSSTKDLAQFAADVIKLGPQLALLNAQARGVGASTGGGPKLTDEQKAQDAAFNQVAAFQALQREAKAATAAIPPLTAVQRELAEQFLKGGMSAQAVVDKLNSVEKTAGVTAAQIQKLADANKSSIKSSSDYTAVLREMTAARIPLTQAQIAQIDLWAKENQSVTNMAKALKVSEVAVSSYIQAQKEYEAQLKKAQTVTDGLGSSLKNYGVQVQLSDGLTTNMISTLKALDVHGKTTIPGVTLATAKLPPEIQKASEEMGRLSRISIQALEAIVTKANAGQKALDDFNAGIQAIRLGQLTEGLASIITGLESIASISGSTAITLVRGFSDMLGAVNTAQAGIKSFANSMEVFKAGKYLAGIAGMATGIMGIVSAAMAAAKAIGAIWNVLDRNKGRDAVKDFAESFGGFDALHKQLNLLGDEGERLWIALTQGVGRNNPEQAARVIGEIEAKLAGLGATMAQAAPMADLASAAGFQTKAQLEQAAAEAVKLYEYMRDSGIFTAEAVQEAWERANGALVKSGDESAIAADKARKAIQALESELKGLYASIEDEAPEEITADNPHGMGVVEYNTRQRIAGIEEEIAKRKEAEKAAAEAAAISGQTVADETKRQGTEVDKFLRDTFGKPMRIPIEWVYDAPEFPGSTGGGSGRGERSGVPRFASGGMMPWDGLAYLHRGEKVLTPQQQAVGGGGGGDTHVTLVMPDGDVLLKQIVKARKRNGLN